MNVNDNNPSGRDLVTEFHELHKSGCFILPNPWDVGTAKALASFGFKALATTSAGIAFTRGKIDGGVPRDEMLEHLREIVRATPLPVNADYLNGFAHEPERVADNVRVCVATGVAGLSIEDSNGEAKPSLYEASEAVARIKAAREAIDGTKTSALLTARCEAFLVDHPNPLRTSIERLTAYAAAGADCLYAPGVSTVADVLDLVRAVAPKPLNVLVSGFNSQLKFSELAEAGVRRISIGSGLALTAWGSFLRAAEDLSKHTSFQSLSTGARTAQLNELFADTKGAR